MTRRRLLFALLLLIGVTLGTGVDALAAPDMMQMAQARPTPAALPVDARGSTDGTGRRCAAAIAEPIGNVASLSGSASVTRNNATMPL